MSSPKREIRPWVGETRPEQALKMVVFPAPLGPIRPVIVPRGAEKLTLFTAITPPNRTERARMANPPSVEVDRGGWTYDAASTRRSPPSCVVETASAGRTLGRGRPMRSTNRPTARGGPGILSRNVGG